MYRDLVCQRALLETFGGMPINISAQAFYNAEKTQFGADWSTRLQVQLLFPR